MGVTFAATAIVAAIRIGIELTFPSDVATETNHLRTQAAVSRLPLGCGAFVVGISRRG